MSRYDSSDVHAPRIMPYKFVEFPRMLHSHDGRKKIVHTTEEKEDALRRGWQLAPDVITAEPEIDPIPLEETEEDSKSKKKR